MDAPYVSSTWETFLKQQAHSINPPPEFVLVHLDRHIPALFKTVISSPEALNNLKTLLNRTVKNSFSIEITRKINSLRAGLLPESMPVEMRKKDHERRYLIPIAATWSIIKSDLEGKIPYIDVFRYNVHLFFQQVINAYRYGSKEDIVPFSDLVVRELTDIYQSKDESVAKRVLASEIFTFYQELSQSQPPTNPQLSTLIEILISLQYSVPSDNGTIWTSIRLENISPEFLFRALFCHIDMIGSLIIRHDSFRSQLKDISEDYCHHMKDSLTTGMYAILCSALNKIDSAFLSPEMRHFAIGKTTVHINGGALHVRNYKLALLENGSLAFKLPTQLSSTAFEKLLNTVYSFNSRDYQTRESNLNQLSCDEVVDMLDYAKMIENHFLIDLFTAWLDHQAFSAEKKLTVLNWNTVGELRQLIKEIHIIQKASGKTDHPHIAKLIAICMSPEQPKAAEYLKAIKEGFPELSFKPVKRSISDESNEGFESIGNSDCSDIVTVNLAHLDEKQLDFSKFAHLLGMNIRWIFSRPSYIHRHIQTFFHEPFVYDKESFFDRMKIEILDSANHARCAIRQED
jgi:hypothetical protein